MAPVKLNPFTAPYATRSTGRYFSGDWSQQFFQNNGRLFFLNKKNIVKKNFVKQSKIAELYTVDDLGEFLELGLSPHGFSQDAAGEIYVLGNNTGTPFGDTGMAQRIIPAEIESNAEACAPPMTGVIDKRRSREGDGEKEALVNSLE